jgi:hypothetical protein
MFRCTARTTTHNAVHLTQHHAQHHARPTSPHLTHLAQRHAQHTHSTTRDMPLRSYPDRTTAQSYNNEVTQRNASSHHTTTHVPHTTSPLGIKREINPPTRLTTASRRAHAPPTVGGVWMERVGLPGWRVTAGLCTVQEPTNVCMCCVLLSCDYPCTAVIRCDVLCKVRPGSPGKKRVISNDSI